MKKIKIKFMVTRMLKLQVLWLKYLISLKNEDTYSHSHLSFHLYFWYVLKYKQTARLDLALLLVNGLVCLGLVWLCAWLGIWSWKAWWALALRLYWALAWLGLWSSGSLILYFEFGITHIEITYIFS